MYMILTYFTAISFRIESTNSQESYGQQNKVTHGAEIKVD